MVIIQESNTPTNYDKPLRITGDRASCQVVATRWAAVMNTTARTSPWWHVGIEWDVKSQLIMNTSQTSVLYIVQVQRWIHGKPWLRADDMHSCCVTVVVYCLACTKQTDCVTTDYVVSQPASCVRSNSSWCPPWNYITHTLIDTVLSHWLTDCWWYCRTSSQWVETLSDVSLHWDILSYLTWISVVSSVVESERDGSGVVSRERYSGDCEYCTASQHFYSLFFSKTISALVDFPLCLRTV